MSKIIKMNISTFKDQDYVKKTCVWKLSQKICTLDPHIRKDSNHLK